MILNSLTIGIPDFLNYSIHVTNIARIIILDYLMIDYNINFNVINCISSW